jgi:hypothetical protein
MLGYDAAALALICKVLSLQQIQPSATMTFLHPLPSILPRHNLSCALRIRLSRAPILSSNRSTLTMSWRSSSTTNEGLVANLRKNGLIKSDAVREAMLKVDRAHFCSTLPYEDSPQTIGYDATISAPHIHASVGSFFPLSFSLHTVAEYLAGLRGAAGTSGAREEGSRHW